METLFVERTTEIRREKELLEKELGVKISLQSNKVTIEGPALKEYEAGIDAVGADLDLRTSIAAPTIRVAKMTVAGGG